MAWVRALQTSGRRGMGYVLDWREFTRANPCVKTTLRNWDYKNSDTSDC
jgi:hypothetical protein